VLFFPMLLQSGGLVAPMLGVLSIRLFDRKSPRTAFYFGMAITTIFAVVRSFLVGHFLVHDMALFIGTCLGVATTLVSLIITRHYVGSSGKPVHDIAEASRRGMALNVITGLSAGSAGVSHRCHERNAVEK